MNNIENYVIGEFDNENNIIMNNSDFNNQYL